MTSPQTQTSVQPKKPAQQPKESVIIEFEFIGNDEYADTYYGQDPPTLDNLSRPFDRMERHQKTKDEERCVEKDTCQDSSPTRCCSPWF